MNINLSQVVTKAYALAKRILPYPVKTFIKFFLRKNSPEPPVVVSFQEAFEKRNQYLSSLPAPVGNVGFAFLTSVYLHTDPDFFSQTADAVLKQSYKNYEWIILCHGPVSECLAAILADLEKKDKIRIYSLEQNLGILGGMAFCLEKATKEFVIPLDSDDLVVPEALSVLARHISTNESVDILYSDEAILTAETLTPYCRGSFDPLLNFSASYIYHLIAFKRDIAAKIGVYSNKSCEYCHDWDTVTRFFINQKKIRHIPEVLYLWRQHTRSISNSGKKYCLAEQSQQETLRFALQAKSQDTNFSIEEFPLFRGTTEYRCRWKKGWPQNIFLLLLQDDVLRAPTSYTESFIREARIPYEHVHSIVTSEKCTALSNMRATLRNLPEDAWCWVVDSRLAPRGQWLLEETAGWFTLVPEVLFLCGNIIDANGIVLDGGTMFSYNGLFGCPEANTHVNDPGWFSMQLRPHCVDAPNSFFFGARISSLLAVLQTVPKATFLNSLGVHIGIQCRLQQKSIGWSPLLQAEMKVPFCPSMAKKFVLHTLPLKSQEAMRTSACFPDTLSKARQYGWHAAYPSGDFNYDSSF